MQCRERCWENWNFLNLEHLFEVQMYARPQQSYSKTFDIHFSHNDAFEVLIITKYLQQFTI